MPTAPLTLDLAHSADADDVFMWWPITGMVDPRSPDRVLVRPALDTAPFRFRSIPEDIQALNRHAQDAPQDRLYHISAISMACYPLVAHRYLIADCGSSFGDGYGPKLVVRDDHPARSLSDLLAAPTPPLVAVPGVHTSAYMALCHLTGGRVRPRPVRFDLIAGDVQAGNAAAGVLIHEEQLTFDQHGLRLIADLGQLWTADTALPLPLGANAVRADLDALAGPGSLARVAQLLADSLDHALSHRQTSLDYAATFSPLKTRAQLDRYIDLYVNRFTRALGPLGREAVARLLAAGAAAGLIPHAPHAEPRFLSPPR